VGSGPRKRYALEQGQLVALDPAELVVVDDHAPDATVLGEHPRLRLDLLRGEDARDRCQQGVSVEQFEIPGELLDAL
jgi:hypothetical protein